LVAEIGDKSEEVVGALSNPLPEGYCGPCYGGMEPASGCCQTCDDVREAYRKKGWSLQNVDDIEQCKREGYGDKLREQSDEGCNIHGHVEVNKVGGNFHFAPGKSFQVHCAR